MPVITKNSQASIIDCGGDCNEWPEARNYITPAGYAQPMPATANSS